MTGAFDVLCKSDSCLTIPVSVAVGYFCRHVGCNNYNRTMMRQEKGSTDCFSCRYNNQCRFLVISLLLVSVCE